MPENNLTVENNNSNNAEVRFLTDEDFLKIPGIYFDTASTLLRDFGTDKEIATKGANFIAKVGFGVGTAIDLTINLSKDENSDEFYVALSTIGKDTIKFAIGRFAIKPLVAAITAGAASLLGLSTAPVWLTVVTTVGVVVATTYATDKVLNLVENELKENIGEFELFSPTIYGKMTRDEFMLQELEQNNQTTKDFCMRMYPKFARYVQTYDLNKIDINGSSPMAYINKISYDKVEQNLTIQTQNEVDSASEAKEISQIIAETTKVQTLTINSQTYNIKELSNLELRNAIENIPQVSFLLSHILIKVGEYLDLGEKGIYKIKSGDTLSTIAQLNGMVTKDLVRLNSWLCDENRVKFLQNKILVDTTLSESELNNVNHTLTGDSNAENILIDANGGDNIEFINLSLVA